MATGVDFVADFRVALNDVAPDGWLSIPFGVLSRKAIVCSATQAGLRCSVDVEFQT
jgi:hypothetical protein